MKKAIIGIVDDAAQAEVVVEELQRTPGIGVNDISVLLPDLGASRTFAHEHNTKAPEGAVAGAGAGGVLGGTLGLLAGIGSLAIPGVGPLIAAGPLLAALSGAAAGAAVGGLSGALIGMGIPEMEAKAYEGKLRGSNVLIAVHTESAESQRAVRDLLKRHGARDVDSTTEASVPAGARS
jgi:hypothetical protein